MTVTAVCDVDRDVLASEALDAAIVATPPSLHRDAVENPAEAGVHVFCEGDRGSGLHVYRARAIGEATFAVTEERRMKQGRGRAYPSFGGIESELSFLVELHARAVDLVADLPTEVIRAEVHGHSIGQLLDHMIRAEISWVSRMANAEPPPPGSTCDEIADFTRSVCAGLTLASEISIGPFASAGQLLRHLHWHWTYHSAQIGLLRKALGHEYEWTFREKSRSS